MLCKQSFLFNGIVLKFNSEFELTGQLIIQKPFYFKGIALSPSVLYSIVLYDLDYVGV